MSDVPGTYVPSTETSSPAFRIPDGAPPPLYGPPPKPRRKLWPWLAGLGVLAVIGGITAVALRDGKSGSPNPAAATAAPTSAGPTVLQVAKANCHYDGSGLDLGDAGRTLILDTQGKDDIGGAPMVTLGCILQELRAPDSVIAHMDSTRALDGRQTDEWDGISAAWTYHPDAGLDLTLTIK
jgi:hypothetical protein